MRANPDCPLLPQSGVPRLCERLGVETSVAEQLVARVPPIIALPAEQLLLQVGG